MTVSYDFVNIPSSPTRVDVPRIDQTKIVRVGDNTIVQKNGITVTSIDYIVTGSDVLSSCEVQQRLETRPFAKQFDGSFDRGSISAFSLRLLAPMTRVDSVSGETVTEQASVTLAIQLPMGTTDLDGLMDFVSAGSALPSIQLMALPTNLTLTAYSNWLLVHRSGKRSWPTEDQKLSSDLDISLSQVMMSISPVSLATAKTRPSLRSSYCRTSNSYVTVLVNLLQSALLGPT